MFDSILVDDGAKNTTPFDTDEMAKTSCLHGVVKERKRGSAAKVRVKIVPIFGCNRRK